MFRSLGKSKIAFVLAILFGISLFFFKGGSTYSNIFNSDTVVAKVSNTSISATKFNRTMQMNINKFNQMIGKEMSGDEIRAFQLHTLALGALINDALFEDEYDDINFKIDEKVIAVKTKERIPNLYDENNQLNELYLNTFLQQQQLKIEDIVQIINFETRDQYFSDAFFNLYYPKYFSEKINNFNNHKREISYIEISLDQIPNSEIINKDLSQIDEELDLFYNKNIDKYMTKEIRDVDYFIIDKDLLNSNFIATDTQVEEYYNSNKKLYFEEEKRSFIQFNFKDIKEAEDFNVKIINLSLDAILDYSSINNIRYNEFESLQSNEVLDEISDSLFSLQVNETSKIIETSLAKHILILKSIKESFQPSIEDIKEKIQVIINQTQTNNYYNDLLNQISEKILDGTSLSNIAKSFNLRVSNISNLTTDYITDQQSDKLLFDNLIEASFQSNQNFVSNVININDNLSYIFNVNQIILPKPINIASIKDKVKIDWQNSKKIESINAKFDANKENINFISELANNYNLKINNLLLLQASNEIPKYLLNQIFNSKENNNVQSIIDNKIYVASVNNIIMDNSSDEYSDIYIEDDIREAFSKELMKRKKISTNDNLVDAIIQRY